MKHTPLPWKYENKIGAGLQILASIPFKANCIEFILKDDYQVIFQMLAHEPWIQFASKEWKEMQKANAEFIVRAVNNHYELLKACKDAKWYLSAFPQNKVLLDLLTKAIAKAEGKE